MPSKSIQQETISKDGDSSFTGHPDDKKLIVQMHKPMWEQLRRLAFDMNISMAELCRQGIEIILEKYKK